MPNENLLLDRFPKVAVNHLVKIRAPLSSYIEQIQQRLLKCNLCLRVTGSINFVRSLFSTCVHQNDEDPLVLFGAACGIRASSENL